MTDLYDDLYDCTVLDASGARIGGVGQVYLDDATGEPTFVTARAGLFGNKEVLVPLKGAFISDGLLQVPFAADQVKQAPAPRSDKKLPPESEAAIYSHYGLEFQLPADNPEGTPIPETAPNPEATPDAAIPANDETPTTEPQQSV